MLPFKCSNLAVCYPMIICSLAILAKSVSMSSSRADAYARRSIRMLSLHSVKSDVCHPNIPYPTSTNKIAGDFTRSFSPSLVLNADYSPVSFMPLSVWNWQDTLRATFSGKATVVSEYNIPIRSVSTSIFLPSVIALTNFHQRQDSGVAPLTRKHIYIRDDFKCQVRSLSNLYCAYTFYIFSLLLYLLTFDCSHSY